MFALGSGRRCLCVILSLFTADRRIADIVNRRTLIVTEVLSQGGQRNVPGFLPVLLACIFVLGIGLTFGALFGAPSCQTLLVQMK